MRMAMLSVLAAILAAFANAGEASGKVNLVRVPDGGIQPQVALDAQGAAHLLYYKGDAGGGDLFYVTTKDGGASFSKALKVNSVPGSAVAAGSIRGAQMALGKDGRAHVAWMGSKNAEPKGPNGTTPMLYARMNDAKDAFEPQVNVMQWAEGLDGGGTVAADGAGNVYVLWHGHGAEKGEERRRVYAARSSDEGKTFARETPATDGSSGACACCGMRAFAASDGQVYVLYRSAMKKTNRDMHLLASRDNGASFAGGVLDPWQSNTCVMSTASFSESPAGLLAAWETKEQVYFTRIDAKTGKPGGAVGAAGMGAKRKHPSVAGNAAGETLLVWTEGTGWNKGGRLVWQLYGKDGKPSAEKGGGESLPVWSFGAAFAAPGGFTIVY